MNLRLAVCWWTTSLEHANALQNLVHERCARISGLHQIFLGRHHNLSGDVIQGQTDLNELANSEG